MIRSLPALVLLACAPTDEAPIVGEPWPDAVEIDATSAPEAGPADARQMVGNLVLAATEPHPGGVATVVVGNANAGEAVLFATSGGGVGVGPCLPQLGGLCLDLGSLTVYSGAAIADAQGVATLEVAIPSTLPAGAVLTFQATARRGAGGATSVKSNAFVRTVGAPSWSNAVSVDGNLQEWSADERFGTTSQDGSGGGVTWDANALYVAFDHSDVATGGAFHWEVVYLATGGPGSSVGATLGSQTPALPFEADLVLRRKADGSYDDLLVWDDSLQRWSATPGILSLPGFAAAESANGLELAIPRSILSHTLQVATMQVYEGGGFESTYAGIPATAFADGYDPDVADALTLDLSSPDPAGLQNP